MSAKKHSLAIDAGNTRVKIGVFENEQLVDVLRFGPDETARLKAFLQENGQLPAILASVKADKDTRWIRQWLSDVVLFQTTMPLPLKMGYETPETLGVDRICNAIGAFSTVQNNCLVIDVGTCIKYDLVTADGTYQGGAISPGIELRYKSMHTFTGKLPLIEDTLQPQPIGKNTRDAMRSGVMHGMRHEMEGFITFYESLYPELTIFLTGGASKHFDLGGKSNIFADENLTLKGLQLTLAHYDRKA